MNIAMHLGRDDAPELVTWEGCTYQVREHVWIPLAERFAAGDGPMWRVLAHDAAHDMWIVGRFDDVGKLVGGVVRTSCGMCAHAHYSDVQCIHHR